MFINTKQQPVYKHRTAFKQTGEIFQCCRCRTTNKTDLLVRGCLHGRSASTHARACSICLLITFASGNSEGFVLLGVEDDDGIGCRRMYATSVLRRDFKYYSGIEKPRTNPSRVRYQYCITRQIIDNASIHTQEYHADTNHTFKVRYCHGRHTKSTLSLLLLDYRKKQRCDLINRIQLPRQGKNFITR